MFSLLRQFQTRFFSGRRYEQSSEGVSVIETPGRTSQWIVGRALCTYHFVDLGNVDKALRTGALENQLELVVPFRGFGYWVHWSDAKAQVWVWDKDRLVDDLARYLNAKDDSATVDFVPESVFAPKLQNGLQIVSCDQGVVAQSWRDEILLLEAFWPSQPSNQDWLRFTRGSGFKPVAWPDDLHKIDTTGRPWVDTKGLSQNLRAYEPKVVLTISLILFALVGFQLFSWLGLNLSIWQAERKIEQLRTATTPVINVRDDSFRLLDSNRRIAGLAQPGQLQYMADVIDRLPKEADSESGKFRKWDYRQNELSFVLSKPTADLQAYAAALESVEGFSSVQLIPNDKDSSLEVNVQLQR